MAAKTITITYVKPTAPAGREATSISPIFKTPETYADTTAFAGTVYDTNVAGFGSLPLAFPYDETSFPYPIPLAQFQAAMVGTSGTVTLTSDDDMVVNYYIAAGKLLASQGFTVTVS